MVFQRPPTPHPAPIEKVFNGGRISTHRRAWVTFQGSRMALYLQLEEAMIHTLTTSCTPTHTTEIAQTLAASCSGSACREQAKLFSIPTEM